MAFGDITDSQVDDRNELDLDTELTVTFAAAPSEDDLVILVVGATATHSAPSGFSEVCNQTDGSQEWSVYYKVAGASESATYAFDIDSATLDRCMIGVHVDGGTNGFDATPVDTSKVDTKESGSSSIETDTSGSGLTSTNADNFMFAGAYNRHTATINTIALKTAEENSFTDIVDARALGSSECNTLVTASRTVTSTGTFNPRFQCAAAVAHPYNYGFVVGFKEGSGGGGGSSDVNLHGAGRGILRGTGRGIG